jgi:hypothetical protein
MIEAVQSITSSQAIALIRQMVEESDSAFDDEKFSIVRSIIEKTPRIVELPLKVDSDLTMDVQ